MTVAQDQQGYFTTKQAIEAGYADNTHPYHVHAGNAARYGRCATWPTQTRMPPPISAPSRSRRGGAVLSPSANFQP
jgi:hypothetical protein